MTPEQATLHIPDDWQLVRVKQCLLAGSQGSKIGPFGSALKLEDLADEGIPVFGQGNVMARDYTFGKRFLTASRFEEMQQYAVQPGDVLITMMGSAGRCDVVPEGTGPAIIDSHLLRLRLADSVDARFFRWFLDESLPAAAQATMASKGSIMAGLNSGIVRDMWFPLAPLPTQRAIADFLDRKTAAIDALIEKKERLLELLAEKRAALIHRAVTKGLDPSVPMKDSGVPWIGEIPEHWTLVGISKVAGVFNGSTPSRSIPEFWDGDLPWLSSGKVNEWVVEAPTSLITRDAAKSASLKLVPRGSLIIGMVGQGKTRGTAARLGIDTFINQNMAAIVPGGRISDRYLHYSLIQAYRPIREYGRGGQQDALNCEIVGAIRVPLPPREEQVVIADYLDADRDRAETFNEANRSLIVRLREYRQALITAAVTGQLDIDAAEQQPIPEPDEQLGMFGEAR